MPSQATSPAPARVARTVDIKTSPRAGEGVEEVWAFSASDNPPASAHETHRSSQSDPVEPHENGSGENASPSRKARLSSKSFYARRARTNPPTPKRGSTTTWDPTTAQQAHAQTEAGSSAGPASPSKFTSFYRRKQREQHKDPPTPKTSAGRDEEVWSFASEEVPGAEGAQGQGGRAYRSQSSRFSQPAQRMLLGTSLLRRQQRFVSVPLQLTDEHTVNRIKACVNVRGSVIPRIMGSLVVCAGLGILGAWCAMEEIFRIPPYWHQMVVMPLGFLLVFRSTLAYNRYWEARGHIGVCMNTLDKWAMCVRAFVRKNADDPSGEVKGVFSKSVSALVLDEALRLSKVLIYLSIKELQQDRDYEDFPVQLTPAEVDQLRTNRQMIAVVIAWLSDLNAALFHTRMIGDQQLVWLQETIQNYGLAIAGALKIKSTPLPIAYAQMLTWLLYIFVLSIPFVFAGVFKDSLADLEGERRGGRFDEYGRPIAPTVPLMIFSAVASFFLAFALLGINATAEELEDPFGNDDNDLPMRDFLQATTDTLEFVLQSSDLLSDPTQADEANSEHDTPAGSPTRRKSQRPAADRNIPDKAISHAPKKSIFKTVQLANQLRRRMPSVARLNLPGAPAAETPRGSRNETPRGSKRDTPRGSRQPSREREGGVTTPRERTGKRWHPFDRGGSSSVNAGTAVTRAVFSAVPKEAKSVRIAPDSTARAGSPSEAARGATRTGSRETDAGTAAGGAHDHAQDVADADGGQVVRIIHLGDSRATSNFGATSNDDSPDVRRLIPPQV